MLKREIEDAINEQIKGELESAYLYLSMAAFCEAIKLPGFANWMLLQSKEEVTHGMKLFHFVHDRGGRVTLQALDKPQHEFSSPLAMMKDTLEHERRVTTMINRLYEAALKEHDYATQTHLQWFINEQVEEEKNAEQIVTRLEILQDSASGLLILDQELGRRTTSE